MVSADSEQAALRQEDLLNLAAMDTLKGYVQQLDTKSMPQFLDQVSEARENETSRHFAISLYSELAQVHKQAVIPYIPRIMASIVRSLPFSGGSQQLHEACAKVVASLARYTLDPTKPPESNQEILCSLCSPLLPGLAGKQGPAGAGAAICLQALVESEKWKFAHSDLHDLICAKATSALAERGTQTVALLHLMKSLAKFSRNAAQQHAPQWLRVGLELLQRDSGTPGSWQHHIAAAQLIAIVVKIANTEKLDIDLQATTEILKACQLDRGTGVQTAVAEALEAVKIAVLEKEACYDFNLDDFAQEEAGLLQSRCQIRRKNPSMEESGLQDLSDSISPRSGISSHETVRSMASSTVKSGMGTKRSPLFPVKQCTEKLLYDSHASPSFFRSSKLKENSLATNPRRVFSELPSLAKQSSDSEVLPSMCVSKQLRAPSLDTQSKEKSSSAQSQVSFGPRKGSVGTCNQIHSAKTKTSLAERKHVEGCHSPSEIGCTCSFEFVRKSGEGTSSSLGNMMMGCTDCISGKGDAKTFGEHDDCFDGSRYEVSIRSAHGCMHDNNRQIRSADDVLCNGCTDLLTPDSKRAAISEGLAASGKGSHIKVGKSHVSKESFIVTTPRRLLYSLQLPSSTGERKGTPVQHFKECMDADIKTPSEASWRARDSPTSGESETDQLKQNQMIFTDSKRKIRTPSSSCCTSEDLKSSVHRNPKGGLHSKQPRFQRSEIDCKRFTVLLDDCEMQASAQGRLSYREWSDNSFIAVDGDEKSDSNHDRTTKESELQRHFCGQMDGHAKISVGLDFKFRDVECSGKVKGSALPRRVVNRQIFTGTSLGVVCAAGILVLAVMVISHVNQSHDLHVLVPT